MDFLEKLTAKMIFVVVFAEANAGFTTREGLRGHKREDKAGAGAGVSG